MNRPKGDKLDSINFLTAAQRTFCAVEGARTHPAEEVFRCGLKQFTGIGPAQFGLAVAQRNHIGLAIRAFVRLEVYRLRTGVSWSETKASII